MVTILPLRTGSQIGVAICSCLQMTEIFHFNRISHSDLPGGVKPLLFVESPCAVILCKGPDVHDRIPGGFDICQRSLPQCCADALSPDTGDGQQFFDTGIPLLFQPVQQSCGLNDSS